MEVNPNSKRYRRRKALSRKTYQNQILMITGVITALLLALCIWAV